MMEVFNEQQKNEYEMQRNVMLNALINSKRKRHSPIIPLFKADEDEMTIEEKLKEREELFGNNA